MPTTDQHKALLDFIVANQETIDEAGNIQAYVTGGAEDIRPELAQLKRMAEIGWYVKVVLSQQPTPDPDPEPDPDPDPEPDPEPDPDPEPEPTPTPVGKGIFVSVEEVKRLGAVPSNVKSAAAGSVKANLADNNSVTDAAAYASALVFAATGDQAAKAKAIEGVKSMSSSGFARVLEMSRNVPMYVWAADLCGYHDSDDFLRSLVTKPLDGHSGGKNMVETAEKSASNWGAMATAACTAIGLHVGDTQLVDRMARVMKGWCDGSHQFNFTGTNWHADPAKKRGVNAKGATRNGNDISGVQPEDFRRAGEYGWPVSKSGYQWEGLTPRIVTAAMLHRAGKFDLQAGDAAIARAVRYLYDVVRYPAEGDDTTVIYLANRLFGLSLPTTGDSISKNVAFCGWTHRA
ncbi:MAG TPA: hypothetical protein VHK88_20205 [Aquihabitans sp.]|jgi:hypothetical protein|nr:hypothetical protein [Aquihabitans sp.]